MAPPQFTQSTQRKSNQMSMQASANSFGIRGRTAVVTGGNRNIGRSIVLTLAKEGVKTIVMYRDGADEAKKGGAEVEAMGGRAAMYQADLADTSSLAPLVKKIETEHGGIDILVNNAAIRPN